MQNSDNQIFVGRETELARFDEFLRDPAGGAMLVIGQQGMGKTMLVNQMMRAAQSHPDLKCHAVRYEVIETDPVDSTLALIMDESFVVSTTDKLFGEKAQREKQLKALFEALAPKGKELTALAKSLKREAARNTRDQFVDFLHKISERLPDHGRLVIVVDPYEIMGPKCDQAWTSVTRQLPQKVKLVFAQRPEDVLANAKFGNLPQVVYPAQEERLDVFDERMIDSLLDHRATALGYAIDELRGTIARYNGHPYAIQGALDLIANGTPLDGLPADPTPEAVAATQWEKVCAEYRDAIPLLEAYAVLEVPVPDKIVAEVGQLDATTLKHVNAQRYIAGLLRQEADGRRIYHSLLAEHILAQIGKDDTKALHGRAAEAYRARINKAEKPNAFAALRLPIHMRAAKGNDAFIDTLVNESIFLLRRFGLYDELIALSLDALSICDENSAVAAKLSGDIGIVYAARGDLDGAEAMYRKSLKIDKQLGRLEGMANQIGNLGNIYLTRGDLETAEDMFRKSLGINKQLGRQEGMANQYGSLGIVYIMQSDFDRAERMYRKSLEINKRLRRLEGVACDYGNLGNVYKSRGDLNEAEAMYRESLILEEQVGRLEGMANQYGNLGNVYQTRGDLNAAEGMYRKSLEINEQIGRLEGMANAYGNLGLVYQLRGDLDAAEGMYRKSLKIEEQLGRLDGMASDYCNLGLVYQSRGDLDAAKDMHRKSLEINERLGKLEGMAGGYCNLGIVYQARGDIEKAREYFQRSLDQFARLGAAPKMRHVRALLDDLDAD